MWLNSKYCLLNKQTEEYIECSCSHKSLIAAVASTDKYSLFNQVLGLINNLKFIFYQSKLYKKN